MKNLKYLLVILFAFAISVKSIAAGDQYHTAMKSAIDMLDTTKKAGDFMQLANTFERIASAEPKEWLPYYYAAYCYNMAAFTGAPKKSIDEYLDKADALLNKADSIQPDNSEIIAVKGMICAGRIMVNPISRGKKYGTLSQEYYQKAMKLDETNPRPYYLQGQGVFYTPKAFGGGKDKAKPILQTAVEKYKTFKPESDIAPHWGQNVAERTLQQCD